MRPFVYLAAGFFFLSTNGFALGHKPPAPHFSAWMAYWDEAQGRQALLRSMKDLDEVSFFIYDFDDAGHIVPETDDLSSFKKGTGPRILYTVVNDKIGKGGTKLKDPEIVHKLIATPQARAAHIQELLALCVTVDGLDIDYERLNPADRDAFTAFIQELGQALHQRRQWLSVVVQPRTAATQLINQSGAGVIDWGAIASSVDEFKEMAYMFHYETSAPGSIAPLAWLMQLVSYAKTIVPLSKLCLVLHLGGFDWPEHGPARPIEFDQALLLAAANHARIDFDAESGSGHFSYADPSGIHTVWIEEEKGLREKIAVLAGLGVRRVGFWRLGIGDPKLWETISKIKRLDSVGT